MAAASEGDEPSPRFWQHTFEHNGKVYIRGGRTSHFVEERGRLETIFECFDPIHKTWQQVVTTGTPHPGLTQAACVYNNGKFYIYGSCEQKVLSQLDLKTMEWSQLWVGSEEDDGKTPMSKAAGGMVYFKGGYLGLFGGYARPTGTLQPGSKWTPNPYEKEKGWTNEFHLFNIKERVWLTPVIRGQRPPPCSDFALNGITGTMAVLFGGYQDNGSWDDLYTIDFGPTKLEVTFTLKEKTKPWPEGRECHTSCCIGLGTDHPQMLISGGKNMRDIALKLDMWRLDVKSFVWEKVIIPADKCSPRYAHSMTTVITYPSLESVVMFGGTSAEFTEKWRTPGFPKLTEMLIFYGFGKKDATGKISMTAKVTLVKQVRYEEGASTSAAENEIKLQRMVDDLEQQLSMLEQHSNLTIKLLKEKNKRLKKQLSLIMSESLPSTVSDSHLSTISVKSESPDDVEMETGDAGPSTLSPASNGGAFQLEGVDVCGETSLMVTNSAQVFEWEGYGLKLCIPDESLPKDCDICKIKVLASLSGQYQFPDDCQLVSAVFWFRCEPNCTFEKPITVEMEHCANLDSASNLCFVRAQCNQPRPYTFSKIGGKFDGDIHFGTIDLTGFSGVASVSSDSRLNYCARMYHFNHNEGENTSYEIDFVVTWDIEAKLTAVEKYYERKNAKLGLDRVIKFDCDSITIDIPVEGVTKEEGWKIIPLSHPAIVEKKTVDCFDKGSTIPRCQFSAIFEHHDRDFIPPLQHQTKLLETRPNSIITFNITPSRKRMFPESAAIGVAPPVKKSKSDSHKKDNIIPKISSELKVENGSENKLSTSKNLSPNSRNIRLLKWKNAEGKVEKFRTVSQIAHKWEAMGGLLEIRHSQLRCWAKDYRSSEECCVAVLNYWLENPTEDYPSTWDGLCELIEDCELTNVADKLRAATQDFSEKPLSESDLAIAPRAGPANGSWDAASKSQ